MHVSAMSCVPDTWLTTLCGLSPMIGSIRWILEVFQIYKWKIEADILNKHSQGMVEIELKFVWVSCLVLQAVYWQTVTPLDTLWRLKFCLTTSQMNRWNSLGVTVMKHQAVGRVTDGRIHLPVPMQELVLVLSTSFLNWNIYLLTQTSTN